MHCQGAMLEVFKEHEVIAEEEKRPEPVNRQKRNNLKRPQDRNYQEVEECRWENAKEAPHVKALHADLPTP